MADNPGTDPDQPLPKCGMRPTLNLGQRGPNDCSWHEADVRPLAGLGLLTGALPTFARECRLAAKGIRFPRRWYGGMISANLEVIRAMSVDTTTKRQKMRTTRWTMT